MAIEIKNHPFHDLKAHQWKLKLGARWEGENVFFRVWAPKCTQIDVMIQQETQQVIPLEKKKMDILQELLVNFHQELFIVIV